MHCARGLIARIPIAARSLSTAHDALARQHAACGGDQRVLALAVVAVFGIDDDPVMHAVQFVRACGVRVQRAVASVAAAMPPPIVGSASSPAAAQVTATARTPTDPAFSAATSFAG